MFCCTNEDNFHFSCGRSIANPHHEKAIKSEGNLLSILSGYQFICSIKGKCDASETEGKILQLLNCSHVEVFSDCKQVGLSRVLLLGVTEGF